MVLINPVLTPFPYPTSPLGSGTPLTYREGITVLGLIEALRCWIQDSVAPELLSAVETAVSEFTAGLTNAENTIIQSKVDWQNLFDAFMADVVAQLEALNDQAITNLLNNESSIFGDAVKFKLDSNLDSTSPFNAHVKYGINGNRAALEAAIATVPLGHRITLPKDMLFDLGDTPININRDIKLSGGTFVADNTAFLINANGVELSDFTINGPGNTFPYVANKAAIMVQGTIENYISFELRNGQINGQIDGGIRAEFVRDFLIRKVFVDDFRYGGIMILSGEDGVVELSRTQNANQPGTLSYGMVATDQVNLEANRCRNITFRNNKIHNIPDWEGMDTHGGVNIQFLNNTITKCRNAIVMGVGSDTRKTAPQGCRAEGNYIDGMSATPLAPENGILLGGSSSTNPNGPLKADAIVINNTILNVTVKTNVTNIMTIGASSIDQNIDYEKCIFANNGGAKRIDTPGARSYEETAYDTGWVAATTYGTYAQGWVNNSSWPLEFRVVGDHRGRTVHMRGSMSRDGGNPPLTNDLFTITHAALKPLTPADGYTLGLLKLNADGGDTRVMVLMPSGVIEHSFPTTPSTLYVTMIATWRI